MATFTDKPPGSDIVEIGDLVSYNDDPENSSEAPDPDQEWCYWDKVIRAAYVHEETFRREAKACEREYFGRSEALMDEGMVHQDTDTNILKATIDTLKPLIYSDDPDPIVRRRFGGDNSDNDPTERVAGIVCQRLAQYMIETSGFREAMELARDDRLVPGRATVRVAYEAEWGQKTSVVRGLYGTTTLTQTVKTGERVVVLHNPWQRFLMGPASTWREVPWVAYEMTRTKQQIAKRFSPEIAEEMDYPINGLKDQDATSARDGSPIWKAETGTQDGSGDDEPSVHDQCVVYEIWERATKQVIWWSPNYKRSVLDKIDDPLEIDGFFSCPKPMLATTIAGKMTPRPDPVYYRARIKEIDDATRRLRKMMDQIILKGFFPGSEESRLKTLFSSETDLMVPVEEWAAFMDKGGAQNLVQWLPIDMVIQAAQALISMREQAKNGLYEISGISDIVRGQTDPNETASAQNLKSNYASVRLRSRQGEMNRFARDTIQIMVDVAFQLFDTATIADIVNYKMFMTEADLAQMNTMVDQAKQQHAMMAMAAQQAGQPAPPPPKFPKYEQTSWERVHEVLRSDLNRKYSLQIETDATILADQEQDKKNRIEFLSALNGMLQQMVPAVKMGVMKVDMLKELMLFGVRGFPNSLPLEGLIEAMPDDFQQDQGPNPELVKAEMEAKLKAHITQLQEATDKFIAQLDSQTKLTMQEREHQHEKVLEGAAIVADAARAGAAPVQQGMA